VTATNLTAEQTAEVLKSFKVYQNEGSVETGKWVYQPHDFDDSFELWSAGYDTEGEAMAAAYAELSDPRNDPEARNSGSGHVGYVITDDGSIYVQVPHENRWGFILCDDGQTWDGGFGLAESWDAISDDDPRITAADRDRLGWILDEHRN
jgi:hypothetical protein